MDYALVFRWTGPIPAREMLALEVLGDIRTYFGKLAAEGFVSPPELFLHVEGSMLWVKGSMEFFTEILGRDDFIVLMDKAMTVAMDFEFGIFTTGEEADRRLALYLKALKELLPA